MKAILIAEPSIDFNLFLGGVEEALNEHLAEEADKSVKQLTGTQKWISCLRHLSPHANFAAHVQLSFLIVLDPYETDEFVGTLGSVATIVRTAGQYDLLLATGTLDLWEQALARKHSNPAFVDIHHVVKEL